MHERGGRLAKEGITKALGDERIKDFLQQLPFARGFRLRTGSSVAYKVGVFKAHTRVFDFNSPEWQYSLLKPPHVPTLSVRCTQWVPVVPDSIRDKKCTAKKQSLRRRLLDIHEYAYGSLKCACTEKHNFHVHGLSLEFIQLLLHCGVLCIGVWCRWLSRCIPPPKSWFRPWRIAVYFLMPTALLATKTDDPGFSHHKQ
ncbi:hypothetical protein VNO77_18950 [Canavalia gladiata]|uniref:Uncharacterized protein n=1 Tax=Canavalia gladiata TaxID=3824 RepID=A0AAN9QP56_CANGL